MARFSDLPTEIQSAIFATLADAEYASFSHQRITAGWLLVSSYEHILPYRMVCRKWRNIISDMDRGGLQEWLPHLRRLHAYYHEKCIAEVETDSGTDESGSESGSQNTSDGEDEISASNSKQYAMLLDKTREVLIRMYAGKGRVGRREFRT